MERLPLVRKRPEEVSVAVPDDPVVMLSDLVIDNADRQVATAPVTGHCGYESSLPRHDGLALRMMYDLRDGSTTSHFFHPDIMLSGRRTLRFSMTPLKKNQNLRDLPQTFPIFFCLCRQQPGTNAPHVPISNTCAALIDLSQ